MNLSIIGDRRVRLSPDWSRETAVGLLGDSEIDASGGANPGAVLTMVSLVGDGRVRVPTGIRVTLKGFNVLGDRRLRVTPGDGPDVTIRMYGLFGDLEVTDGTA